MLLNSKRHVNSYLKCKFLESNLESKRSTVKKNNFYSLTKLFVNVLVFFSLDVSAYSYKRVEGIGKSDDKSSHIHACRAAEIEAWNNADSNCYRKYGVPVASKIYNSTYGFLSCDCNKSVYGFTCTATAWISCEER